MKEEIEKMLAYLPQLTKDESDFIKEIIEWPDETKAAFLFAKQIFEDVDFDSTNNQE